MSSNKEIFKCDCIDEESKNHMLSALDDKIADYNRKIDDYKNRWIGTPNKHESIIKLFKENKFHLEKVVNELEKVKSC